MSQGFFAFSPSEFVLKQGQVNILTAHSLNSPRATVGRHQMASLGMKRDRRLLVAAKNAARGKERIVHQQNCGSKKDGASGNLQPSWVLTALSLPERLTTLNAGCQGLEVIGTTNDGLLSLALVLWQCMRDVSSAWWCKALVLCARTATCSVLFLATSSGN